MSCFQIRFTWRDSPQARPLVVDGIEHSIDEVTAVLKDVHSFVTGLGNEHLVENLDQFAAVLAPGFHLVEMRVVDQLLNSQATQKSFQYRSSIIPKQIHLPSPHV